MKNVLILSLTVLLVAVAGCNRGTTQDDAAAAASSTSSPSTAATITPSSGGGASRSPEQIATEERLRQLVVYFDYDQADIKPEFTQMLAAHGQRLAANANSQVRLEGHADERGSREYNIGLGERRAQAVRRALSLQGAAAGQLSTVSYGEERPAATGSDEESWRLNRRVELVYR